MVPTGPPNALLKSTLLAVIVRVRFLLLTLRSLESHQAIQQQTEFRNRSILKIEFLALPNVRTLCQAEF